MRNSQLFESNFFANIISKSIYFVLCRHHCAPLRLIYSNASSFYFKCNELLTYNLFLQKVYSLWCTLYIFAKRITSIKSFHGNFPFRCEERTHKIFLASLFICYNFFWFMFDARTHTHTHTIFKKVFFRTHILFLFLRIAQYLNNNFLCGTKNEGKKTRQKLKRS